jgi:hypothetical protein
MELMSHPVSTTEVAPASGRVRWRTVAWTLSVFLVAAGLTIARLPVAAREGVWAEDGVYFLADSDREGVWATLLKPYMGYLHFLPRLIVISTSEFADLTHFAVIVSVVCCLAVGAITALVFYCSSAVTGWLPARLAIASITVLVPTAPIEVLGNAANLHWYLIWASVWLLLYVPKTWWGSIALGVLGASFALTEILVALLAPLVFYRFRAARAWPVRIGYGLGLIAQAVATLSNPRQSSTDPPDFETSLHGYLIQGVSTAFIPFDTALGSLLADTGAWIGGVLFIPFGLSWLYLLWRGRNVTRVAAVTLLAISIAVFALAFHGVVMSDYWDYPDYTDRQFALIAIQRYSVISSMCLLALPLLAVATARERWMARVMARAHATPIAHAEDAAQRAGAAGAAEPAGAAERALAAEPAGAAAPAPRRRRIARGTGSVLVTLLPFAMIAGLLVGFIPNDTRREGHPNWAETVEQARDSCKLPDSPGWGSMEVAPGGAWDTILSCETLLDGAADADDPTDE